MSRNTRSFFLCALLALALAGCGAAELNTAGLSPVPTPAATAAPEPAATAAAASPMPAATPSPGAFDPAAAAYRGNILDLTGSGFTLAVAQVTQAGDNAAALSSTGAALTVQTVETTRYIAIYANPDGHSRQEPGTAELLDENAFVYLTGSEADGVFTADTVAVLNP